MKPDKLSLLLTLLIILSIFSWISSCTHPTDTSDIPKICFNDVMGIISGQCSTSNCHGGGGEAFPLTEYKQIYDIVTPFNADASPLYKAITSVRGEKQMPPDQPISQESRTKIRFWIEQGAIDNRNDPDICKSSPVKGNGSNKNFSDNK
jgi:hypothetical protein